MKLKLNYFGQIAELMNTSSAYFELTKGHTVQHLRHSLNKEYPKLAEVTYQVAVNQQLVSEDIEVLEADEIALLPPFAGG